MIIKEIPQTDYQEVYQLYCDSFNKKTVNKHPNINTKNLIGLYLDNELIGLAQLDYFDNNFENVKIAYLNNFCIKEKYRHQGFGDTLLKECLNIAKTNGATSIQLTSNKNRIYAHMLYQKNNFQIIDTIFLKKEI